MTASAPRTDELRLALVLNGGVSLAVWMGGVAFELNRLVRETQALFIGVLLMLVAVLRGITRRRGVRNGEECGEIS